MIYVFLRPAFGTDKPLYVTDYMVYIYILYGDEIYSRLANDRVLAE